MTASATCPSLPRHELSTVGQSKPATGLAFGKLMLSEWAACLAPHHEETLLILEVGETAELPRGSGKPGPSFLEPPRLLCQ